MGLFKSIFAWWDGPTWGTRLGTRRFGTEMGRDDAGNVYYQSDGGKRRWVIFAGDNEATLVPPDWHGWLRRTVDAVPAEQIPVKVWEKPWVPNMTGTAEAYAPSGAMNKGGRRARATGDYQAWTPD